MVLGEGAFSHERGTPAGSLPEAAGLVIVSIGRFAWSDRVESLTSGCDQFLDHNTIIRKSTAPQDRSKTLSIRVRQGPKGVRCIVSEVPLYAGARRGPRA